ncbi:MAG: phosphotransferase family protein [Myxococcota bacterium]|nr:phosphotransferase family protein [Myxococcota bacterium]
MSEVPPGIDVQAVERFFASEVPGGEGPLEFSLIAGGRSNLTYRVRARGRGERDFVLRRPPLGHVIETAHDMAREYRVITALADSRVPVPRTWALCEDPSINGAPFYVMDYQPGVVLEGELPEGFAEAPSDRWRIGTALVETLAALHEVDPAAVGLSDFGRPEGYLARQVARWGKQWERNRVEEAPIVEALLERLERALPEESGATLVHGDYRLGNVALDPDDPGRLVAVYDWEMATLGDPLADLGYCLIYWVEPGDARSHFSAYGVTALEGFPSRAELVAEYARLSGRDISDVDFYRVLALTKLAVISEGIYARFRKGKTVGEGFDGMKRATVGLAEAALAIAEASEIPALRAR